MVYDKQPINDAAGHNRPRAVSDPSQQRPPGQFLGFAVYHARRVLRPIRPAGSLRQGDGVYVGDDVGGDFAGE